MKGDETFGVSQPTLNASKKSVRAAGVAVAKGNGCEISTANLVCEVDSGGVVTSSGIVKNDRCYARS
jgi:hypothetical protein